MIFYDLLRCSLNDNAKFFLHAPLNCLLEEIKIRVNICMVFSSSNHAS